MSGSIGQIMNPGTVAPINVPEQQVNAMKPAIGYAQLQAAQLQPGLIGAQTAETQARAGLTEAQASAVPSEIGLRQAQTALTSAQVGKVPAEIAQTYASAGQMNAGAAEAVQRAYGTFLQNYQQAPRAGMIGGALGVGPPPTPPPPSYSGSPTQPQPISQVIPPQLAAPFPNRVGFNPNDPHNEAALAQVPPDLRNTFYTAAQTADVPLPFLVAQGMQESNLNPNIGRGKAGEYGIMQVMPGTGAAMGYTEQQLADPATNIMAGARYYRQKLDESNNPLVAGAAYNTGNTRTAVPNYVLGTPQGSPGLLGHLNRIYNPGAAAATQPVQIPGMPGPAPALMATDPGGLAGGTPDQRAAWQTQRANTMMSVFTSEADPADGVKALAAQGYITPQQQTFLANNPDQVRNFISRQLPIGQQPTPGEKTQIANDTPLIENDVKVNQENVDAGLKAGTDQYNLKNIKTLVNGTPDNLMGAAAQTRLAIQSYAREFGGSWPQGLSAALTGVESKDVPVLQDLQKDFLANVLANERTQGVQRIGAMSTQYFAKASPSIDMTKPAVQQITNLGLVAQQMTRDFADASNQAFDANRTATNQSLVSGPYQPYKTLASSLQKEWLSPDSPHSPDVYAAAANLMNGMPPSKAFAEFNSQTDVGRAKQTEALNIIKRTDPSEMQAIMARRGL